MKSQINQLAKHITYAHLPISFTKYLYNLFNSSHSFLSAINIQTSHSIIDKSHISNIVQANKYFPHEIMTHIIQNINMHHQFTFAFNKRKFIINFYSKRSSNDIDNRELSVYIEYIMLWLHVITNNKHVKCIKQLTVNIFLTPFKKKMNSEQLTPSNVNTGFSNTCLVNNEITIYRKEEWFKVFIHETFHAFGLDFSNVNQQHINSHLQNIFHFNIDYNLFEAYTETWARIINVGIICYMSTDSLIMFSNYCNILMHLEKVHSIIQMNKIMKHVNLTYSSIINNSDSSTYEENTNIFAYYVITALYMNSYAKYISWCNLHNDFMFKFRYNQANINKFLRLTETLLKSSSDIFNPKYRDTDSSLRMTYIDIYNKIDSYF